MLFFGKSLFLGRCEWCLGLDFGLLPIVFLDFLFADAPEDFGRRKYAVFEEFLFDLFHVGFELCLRRSRQLKRSWLCFHVHQPTTEIVVIS